MAEVANVASLEGNIAVGPGVGRLGGLGSVQSEVEIGWTGSDALIIGFTIIFIRGEEGAHA